MADVLTATGLTVVRGGRRLIDGLDLSVPEGTVTALTGSNGAGKSTLAWCLGLYTLDYSGTITFSGTSTSDMSPRHIRQMHRCRIILQPQDLLLEDSWTVSAALHHAARALRQARRQRPAQVSHAMTAAGVTHLARTRIGLLSGGERMRVALARTLLMPDPALVILDEPSAGADEELSSLVIDLVDRWVAQSAAVLVVTHDPRLITRADREIPLGSDHRHHHHPDPAQDCG